MNKLFVVHYYPVDYFPPVMNLINTLQDKAKICVVSTKKSNALDEYKATGVRIFKPIRENKADSSIMVLLKYLYFSLFTLLMLITNKPDTVLYYESVSAFPVFLYKRFFRCKAKVCIHYHEYMTLKEYCRPGMRLSKFNHQLEISHLYNVAFWISQTNECRKNFFLKDYPFINPSKCQVMPNYPPRAWHIKAKNYATDGIVRCVYVGSLSLHDTYVKEFCEWVTNQQGKVTFDIYSFNFYADVKSAIEEIGSPYITFHEGGIAYYDIPAVLAKYDVGLLLYKATTLNVKYCETNKFYEYLISGLDVWYTKEMTLLENMDKHAFSPDIQSFEIKANNYPKVDTNSRITDNCRYNLFCENVYDKFWFTITNATR